MTLTEEYAVPQSYIDDRADYCKVKNEVYDVINRVIREKILEKYDSNKDFASKIREETNKNRSPNVIIRYLKMLRPEDNKIQSDKKFINTINVRSNKNYLNYIIPDEDIKTTVIQEINNINNLVANTDKWTGWKEGKDRATLLINPEQVLGQYTSAADEQAFMELKRTIIDPYRTEEPRVEPKLILGGKRKTRRLKRKTGRKSKSSKKNKNKKTKKQNKTRKVKQLKKKGKK